MPLMMSFISLFGKLRSHDRYFIAITAKSTTSPIMNGIQNLAKKVILEISKFTFNQHHHTSRVYSARTQESAFAAEHTLVHLDVCTLILTTAHQCVNLAEIELRQVACCTCRSARSATDAALQLGHLVHDFVALVQVVAVDVDCTGFVYGKSEINHCLAWVSYSLQIHFAAARAAAVPSLRDSPMFFGAVTAPA